MRVNEENFTTGDVEDIEPSYVEQVVGNHNNDEGAHPDIRKMINQTQAFYQNAKDYVEGVAEAAYNSAREAAESANFAADEAIIANEAKTEAVNAKEAAEAACDAAKMIHPTIIDGEWFLYSEEEGCLAPSGVMATGPKPEKGTDYWTEEDKAEIKAYVDEAVLGGEW